jgi:hypothetical protein
MTLPRVPVPLKAPASRSLSLMVGAAWLRPVVGHTAFVSVVADADDILIAIEQDADPRLVGAVDIALDAPGS